MSKKTLIIIILAWLIITLINHYLVNFFILAFELLGLILILSAITVYQIIKLVKEGKETSRFRISKVLTFILLTFLTINGRYIDQLIEKVDWKILYPKRNQVVEKVRNKELNPNVEWNNWICELPFEVPLISHGGNDIGISRNGDKLTIHFWVFRNFLDSPSTYFIYSNDPDDLEKLEKKISSRPKNNWRIQEHWYRIYGDF